METQATAEIGRASADVFVPLAAGFGGIILVVHDTGSDPGRRLTVA